jgi:hypothetical protein
MKASPIKERFMKHVHPEPNSGCWLWAGGINRYGYGKFSVTRSKANVAYRVSYRIFVEEPPEGAHICHKCDNKLCVNPDHLFLGNHAINMHDAKIKGRMHPGEKHGLAKLTKDAVLDIRSSGLPTKVLAKKYGVSTAHICFTRRGNGWGHIS